MEDYQHAVAALQASYYSLKSAQAQYDQALSQVQGTSVSTHPWVLASADQLRNAWVQLYRTRIYSPVEGLAAQRTIQVGMSVKAGEPMLSVIPLDQIWVNANYKETQMRHMRIGQPVHLTSDLYGRNIVFHGRIVGLPGAAGNAFSLLPPQNLSGNWIKIVQRLPVRVALDPNELKNYPLRIGLSMEAVTDLTAPGQLLPTSSAGSPLYATSIFQPEEFGDRILIDEVIRANADPQLAAYVDNPI
jgi:membrane fusion protein (multidrug efflux system)